jgi:hypothetical protein
MIDATRRLGEEVQSLIRDEQYFVIHAARQTGKTTLLKGLARLINAGPDYHALYCSLENAQGISNPEEGIPTIIDAIKYALDTAKLPCASNFGQGSGGFMYSVALQRSINKYCEMLDKPLVVFFDESDCLSGQTLINFLRQIRNGYVNRPEAAFIHSLGLIGMRNIRDYRYEYRSPETTMGSASPFNIVTASMTLRNFNHGEIAELYAQHTDDMGQEFEESSVDLVWRRTQGQPWLVNAIAREIVGYQTEHVPLKPINGDMVETAAQSIILHRGTHFDSLMARLREERVRRVIEPVIIGETDRLSRLSDDYLYAKDIGLIRDDRGKVEIANPIYADVIVRTLNWDTQQEIEERGYPYDMPRYLKDGLVDMDCLLRDFQAFWRENSAIWRERYEYKEAAPHLVLQAFLQRVINGGGQIYREMAAETRRVDLCVAYGGHRYPIELKLRYGDDTRSEGMDQISEYMDTLGCDTGWLVIFDRRKTVSWEEKLYVEKTVFRGKTLLIYGC